MKLSRRGVVIAVSALVLVAGIVLGMLPAMATLTQIKPEVRQLTVSCGNGFLAASPRQLPGDLVALPEEPDVYLARASFEEHCADVLGVRRYLAWGLTGLGVLGLAGALASGAGSAGSSGSSSGGSATREAAGGAHRNRHSRADT